MVERLARAVHHAHEQGIVHRDLKPGNILIAENGDPKITDFGLAKCLDGSEETLTNTSAIMGTPAYMAPEVARGEMRGVGPAVDIYALGAILHELLTGQVPFPGRNQQFVLDLIRSRKPQSPTSLRPDIPPDMEAICLNCLEKAPANRPASALGLAEKIRDTFNGARELPGQAPAQRNRAANLSDLTGGIEQPSTDPTSRHDHGQPPTVELSKGPYGALIGRQLIPGFEDGGWLSVRLQRERLSEREALALVATLARAVHYMHHALGDLVVHRNLRPSNVMFTATQVPKVVNFELVHAPSFGTHRLDPDGTVVGTPAYMAPEQVKGAIQDIGPWTDVYGLGGILYHALTGQPPNGKAPTMTMLLVRLLKEPPIPPRQHNPRISRRVEKICLKALEKDPYRRHASALELAEDLERALKR
jgi:serine/threonine protein kinase